MTIEITEMNDRNYHALDALNASGIKELIKSPAHYKAAQGKELNGKAIRIGTAVHQIVLGGDNVRTFDGASFTSKAAKIWVAENQGYTHLLQKEWDEANIIAEALITDLDFQDLAAGGDTEVAAIGEYKGVFVKAKADILRQADRLCVDVKTTTDLLEFEKSVRNYRYDIQAAWYNRIFGTHRFVFAVVQSVAPHIVDFFELDQEYIDGANADIDIAMSVYRNCLATGNWNYKSEVDKGAINMIRMPAWMKK